MSGLALKNFHRLTVLKKPFLQIIHVLHIQLVFVRRADCSWSHRLMNSVPDVTDPSFKCPSKKKKVLESCASLDNCAKNLFSSPGGKRRFTRHPSLIKLAKSIQDDRRKINSAPSSPVKCALGEQKTQLVKESDFCLLF